MQTPAHILIVDDDLETRKLLGRYLTDQGYRVSLASDQRTTKEALLVDEVSLIVLDVLLPDGSGLDVCRDLRREGSDIPVIILMALKEDVDRIIGLEIGADEYLGKPFNRRELLARIRAVLRRSPNGFRASRARLAQLAGSQPHSAAASLVRYCRMDGAHFDRRHRRGADRRASSDQAIEVLGDDGQGRWQRWHLAQSSRGGCCRN
jgi:DNA-binding response OmpR family regulator